MNEGGEKKAHRLPLPVVRDPEVVGERNARIAYDC